MSGVDKFVMSRVYISACIGIYKQIFIFVSLFTITYIFTESVWLLFLQTESGQFTCNMEYELYACIGYSMGSYPHDSLCELYYSYSLHRQVQSPV